MVLPRTASVVSLWVVRSGVSVPGLFTGVSAPGCAGSASLGGRLAPVAALGRVPLGVGAGVRRHPRGPRTDPASAKELLPLPSARLALGPEPTGDVARDLGVN